METATITITLDAETARRFETASAEEREQITRMIALLLGESPSAKKARLQQFMDELSDAAHARGLTQDILDDILADDE